MWKYRLYIIICTFIDLDSTCINTWKVYTFTLTFPLSSSLEGYSVFCRPSTLSTGRSSKRKEKSEITSDPWTNEKGWPRKLMYRSSYFLADRGLVKQPSQTRSSHVNQNSLELIEIMGFILIWRRWIWTNASHSGWRIILVKEFIQI